MGGGQNQRTKLSGVSNVGSYSLSAVSLSGDGDAAAADHDERVAGETRGDPRRTRSPFKLYLSAKRPYLNTFCREASKFAERTASIAAVE
jgi:hypothetical protein